MKLLDRLVPAILGVLLFPLVVYVLFKWNTHEWETLHRCSLGYDYELPSDSKIL